MRLRPLARRGLTLIELTVVLLILAATAGILVPRLTGYGERAHGSTTAASMNETAKALALFEANNGRLPNNWDNLIDVTGGGTGLPASLTDVGVSPLSLTAGTLAAGEAAPLIEAGITNVHNFDSSEAGFNATFQPWDGGATPTPTTVADSMPIAIVDGTAVGLTAGDRVVALGLNSTNEMLGTVLTNPPVVFEGGLSPEAAYLRVVLILQIGEGGTTLEKARPVAVLKVEPADGSLAGAGTHLQVYYDSRDQ